MIIRSYNPDPELIVTPYKHGIKLLRPGKASRSHHSTVTDILALPCNTYWLDTESKVVNGNLSNAKTMYFDSVQASIGKSLADTPMSKESIARTLANDSKVAQHKTRFYFDEICYSGNEAPIEHLSVKLPWYNDDNKFIGIVGFSIIIGKQSLAESLSDITKMGLLCSSKSQTQSLEQFSALEAEKIYLTPKETEILKLLIKGMRCPEIAQAMQLSKRTIEHYTVSIKEKFRVSSKHELLEKAMYLMRDYHIL